MQKLSEGVTIHPPAGATGLVSEEELLAREYVIDIGGALQKSWNIFTGNPGLNVATILVVGLCAGAGGVISYLVGMVVPLANNLLSLLYSVPLAAGLLWYFLRQARGQSVLLGDAFAGFTTRWGHLVLFGLVQFLFTILCLLPVIGVGIGFVISASAQRSGPPQVSPGLIVGLIITGLIGLAGVVYVSTIFSFTSLLILDKGYQFWPAMQLSRKAVSRRWWMTFFFHVVAGIIQLAGLLLCLVGGLASIPVHYGMKSVFYDENFRDLRPRS